MNNSKNEKDSISHILNDEQYDLIEKVFSEWTFNKELLITNDTNNTNNTNNREKNRSNTDIRENLIIKNSLKLFTERVYELTNILQDQIITFSKSELLSGAVCFFGGIISSLVHLGYVENVDGMFTVSLCYMLIDHFLDDKNIDDKEKHKCMKEIYAFMKEPSLDKLKGNKILLLTGKKYMKMIEKYAHCKTYIFNLFKSELEGVAIQKRKDLPREVYANIANKKGSDTTIAIKSLFSKNIDYNDGLLGEIVQSVDDYNDIQQDISDNIYTLARYDYDRGLMDLYIFEVVEKIHSLDSIYNIFKPILLYGLLLSIHENRFSIAKDGSEGSIHNISDRLFSIISPYIIFDKDVGKESLVDFLCQYI